MAEKLLTIYIDNVAYQVDGQDNLLAGVLSQKLNLPYFCWHPAMGSVGACRQCAVTQYQDETDEKGRLVMACTTQVTDGMRISLKDKPSREFREQIIAAMMTNHPHDCPVCAEGGECHLQDMTVMTGHSARHYKGQKRTFVNQHLGEFIGHEMNRCITCYRCVRFYKDYAGGDDFGVFGSKNQVYFGRQQDGQLQSEFSGNLVEVCPTGVFTNKVFSAHYARKWDLQSAPSICSNCAVGCNTSVGERYGSVRRVMNRYHHEINGYFLCDHGRFGLSYVNDDNRITQTSGISHQHPTGLTRFDIIKALLPYRKKRFLGIGSARASIESNQLLQIMVGEENYNSGFNASELALARLHQQYLFKHQAVNVSDMEQCDFVLIIDEDITQSAPRIALAIRQALRQKGINKAQALGVPHWQDSAVRTITAGEHSPFYQFCRVPTKLDTVAKGNSIQPSVLTLKDISAITAALNSNDDTYQQSALLCALVDDLKQAKKPLIISGWDHQNSALLSATIALIDAIKQVNTNALSAIIPPQVNTVGQLSLLTDESIALEQQLTQACDDEDIAGVIILENELTASSAKLIQQMEGKVCVVIDYHNSEICHAADIVMPSTPVSESTGHFVNYQTRIQLVHSVLPAVLPAQQAWQWLGMVAQGLELLPTHFTDVNSFQHLHDWLKSVVKDWPIKDLPFEHHIVREPHRASGRTAKMANQSVHEAKTTQSDDGYRFSMEGDAFDSTDEMPFVWAPGWNSNQAITQYQTKPSGKLVKRQADEFLPITSSAKQREIATKGVFEPLEQHYILTVGALNPWYQRANLTRDIPEFIALTSENVLYVSAHFLTSSDFADQQWVQVELLMQADTVQQNTHQQFTDNKTVLAKLTLLPTLNDQHSVLKSADIRGSQGLVTEIRPATDADVTQYQQAFQQRLAVAKDRQVENLKQLKARDQMIPIRLIAGGLEDA